MLPSRSYFEPATPGRASPCRLTADPVPGRPSRGRQGQPRGTFEDGSRRNLFGEALARIVDDATGPKQFTELRTSIVGPRRSQTFNLGICHWKLFGN